MTAQIFHINKNVELLTSDSKNLKTLCGMDVSHNQNYWKSRFRTGDGRERVQYHMNSHTKEPIDFIHIRNYKFMRADVEWELCEECKSHPDFGLYLLYVQ